MFLFQRFWPLCLEFVSKSSAIIAKRMVISFVVLLHLLIIMHGTNVLDTQIIMYFIFCLTLVYFENKVSPPINNFKFDCHSCKVGKSKTLPFPTHQSTFVKPSDLQWCLGHSTNYFSCKLQVLCYLYWWL